MKIEFFFQLRLHFLDLRQPLLMLKENYFRLAQLIIRNKKYTRLGIYNLFLSWFQRNNQCWRSLFSNAFVSASDQVIRRMVKLSTFQSTPRMAEKSTKEVAAAAAGDRRMKIMRRNRDRAVGRKYAVQASIWTLVSHAYLFMNSHSYTIIIWEKYFRNFAPLLNELT